MIACFFLSFNRRSSSEALIKALCPGRIRIRRRWEGAGGGMGGRAAATAQWVALADGPSASTLLLDLDLLMAQVR